MHDLVGFQGGVQPQRPVSLPEVARLVLCTRKVDIKNYMEKGIQIPKAPGRSTKVISMIKWIRKSRSSIKYSFCALQDRHFER